MEVVKAMLSVILALLMSANEPPQSPGMYEETFESSQAGSIRYTLSIPKSYEPGHPRPLVLALHYGGPVTPYYGKGFLTQLVEPGLKKLGAVLVAPDCPSRDWTNPVSDKAVMELLGYIMENYAVDEKRILVTGYSMGGHGAWYMAARHPDFFAAALPMAGSPPPGTLERVAKMPICIIHGADDRVVPIGPTREALEELEARGATVELIVARRVDHYRFSGFVPHLKRAAQWINEQFNK